MTVGTFEEQNVTKHLCLSSGDLTDKSQWLQCWIQMELIFIRLENDADVGVNKIAFYLLQQHYHHYSSFMLTLPFSAFGHLS